MRTKELWLGAIIALAMVAASAIARDADYLQTLLMGAWVVLAGHRR